MTAHPPHRPARTETTANPDAGAVAVAVADADAHTHPTADADGTAGADQHVSGETLHRLVHTYRRALSNAMQDADIPMPISHKRALKWIIRIPGITAQQMAEKSGQDKAQITRLVKELEHGGMIEKHPHPEDRRSQTLHLTPRGMALMEEFKSVEHAVRSRMNRGLTPAQIRDFVTIANLMADNLDE